MLVFDEIDEKIARTMTQEIESFEHVTIELLFSKLFSNGETWRLSLFDNRDERELDPSRDISRKRDKMGEIGRN